MSRFVKIATQIKDIGCLRSALADVDARVVEGTSVQGYRGRRKVELAAVTSRGEVGFQKRQDGFYEVVADDMSVPHGFVDRLTQRYARHKVVKEATNAGFNVTEENVQKDNSIRLVVRKW